MVFWPIIKSLFGNFIFDIFRHSILSSFPTTFLRVGWSGRSLVLMYEKKIPNPSLNPSYRSYDNKIVIINGKSVKS